MRGRLKSQRGKKKKKKKKKQPKSARNEQNIIIMLNNVSFDLPEVLDLDVSPEEDCC